MSEPPQALDDGAQSKLPQPEQQPKKRSVLAWMPFGKTVDPTTVPVVSSDEVFALLTYSARKGIQARKVEALSREIHKPQPDPSAVASLYAGLTSATRPVTGQTLLDSEAVFRRLYGIATVTTIFFVLAVGNTIVGNWVADLVLPEEEGLLLRIKRYAWDYLTPFFWGGLGACVFLLKKVQDAAKDNVYDQHQMQGWGTRVLIGGILAAIVLIIFDPSAFSEGPVPLRPAAIAFLVGLSVKAVYGGLERLIDEISNKIAGDKKVEEGSA